MSKNLNLTEGKITGTLAKLALPIMDTSFIQMAYGLTDTIQHLLGNKYIKHIKGNSFTLII